DPGERPDQTWRADRLDPRDWAGAAAPGPPQRLGALVLSRPGHRRRPPDRPPARARARVDSYLGNRALTVALHLPRKARLMLDNATNSSQTCPQCASNRGGTIVAIK